VVSGTSAERSAVTTGAVVSAALDLLAEGGLEAVSFRRIAARLGVSGPTLYWHVDSKRRLMDLMAEELVRRGGTAYTGPEHGQPWWEWLRTDARRMFRALIGTRDAPRVLAGNRPSAESFAGIERVLRVLVDAGLTPGQAQNALFAVGAYVIGSATEWQAEAERAREQPLPSPDDEGHSTHRARILADQPTLLAAIDERVRSPDDAAFEFGLDLIVEGLRTKFVPTGRAR
jgi:TetR/AcrR family transcriptional regulator, tetracycline repressor protein